MGAIKCSLSVTLIPGLTRPTSSRVGAFGFLTEPDRSGRVSLYLRPLVMRGELDVHGDDLWKSRGVLGVQLHQIHAYRSLFTFAGRYILPSRMIARFG